MLQIKISQRRLCSISTSSPQFMEQRTQHSTTDLSLVMLLACGTTFQISSKAPHQLRLWRNCWNNIYSKLLTANDFCFVFILFCFLYFVCLCFSALVQFLLVLALYKCHFDWLIEVSIILLYPHNHVYCKCFINLYVETILNRIR